MNILDLDIYYSVNHSGELVIHINSAVYPSHENLALGLKARQRLNLRLFKTSYFYYDYAQIKFRNAGKSYYYRYLLVELAAVPHKEEGIEISVKA